MIQMCRLNHGGEIDPHHVGLEFQWNALKRNEVCLSRIFKFVICKHYYLKLFSPENYYHYP